MPGGPWQLATWEVWLPLLALSELLVALGVGLIGVNEETLRQQVTPDGLLGRMGATVGVAGGAAAGLGWFDGGLLAGVVGLPALLAVSATATLGSGLWLLHSPIWQLGRADSLGR